MSEDRSDELARLQDELEQLRMAMKQQAERLHFVEQALTTINSPVTIADVRQPDNPLIFVNAAFEHLTGYTAAEIVGHNSRVLQNGDYDQPGIAEMRRAIAEGRNCTVMLRNYQKNGTMFWSEVSLSPIVDENGYLTHFIGIHSNITTRKAAEENLQTTKGQLQAILDNSVVAIFIKDLSGCYIMANRRYYDMIGLPPDANMEGRYDFEFFPSERATALHVVDQQVLLENREVEVEDTFTRDGQQFTHLTVKFPLRNLSGHPYAIGGISTDITLRKQAEIRLQEALGQQRDLNELKVRFVSMASHEFRTPLAAILATAESLTAYRQKMSEPDIDRRLDKIQNQVKHLRGIIDDVLQLTRIQATQAAFNPENIDLDLFCRDTLEGLQNQREVMQHFVYTCSEQPFEAWLDPKLMRQVLENLLSNTIKYSEKDKTVWLDVTRDTAGIVIKVRDEGIGIPEEDLKDIFVAFHRAANVGAAPGTGLGLAIISQAVELHGGTITVESTVGIGTTFTVKIPQDRKET